MDGESTAGTAAGLLRRLAALFYDLLLVTALAVVTTFAMLPLTRGEAILASTQGPIALLYHAVLVLVVFGYFGWCWTRSGQTLGLKAWRLRLRRADGQRLGWGDGLVRFTLGMAMAWMAVLGAWQLRQPGNALESAAAAMMLAPAIVNLAWILVDPAGRSLQDLAGGTNVVRLA